MLQRYLITADLNQAHAVIESAIAATDVADLKPCKPNRSTNSTCNPAGSPLSTREQRHRPASLKAWPMTTTHR